MIKPTFLARVLYNQNPEAMLYGARQGDIFQCVYLDEYLPIENLGLECERLFSLLNKDDKTELMGRQGAVMDFSNLRSMSVGDCIAFTRIVDNNETILGTYSCDNRGWSPQPTVQRVGWKDNSNWVS